MIKEFAQHLKTYLSSKKQLGENYDNLKLSYDELLAQYEETKCERTLLFEKVNNLRKSLNSALDEITNNQQRIDSLLRQLKEKNGGR